ncbi:sporulation integral membrane protein YlbJ [Thermoflavimicrobium dichotomicum]|uniref:Sporulation integral membrane protein YlbJ n=1 Tax=Thermoflavimicrobium dichotomicum TaxID=46223 RepID=A0A1I3SSG7_9BACL|nr:sporulation integral membrane protein YlbJ [Thermoflavimicrobium dichotomicum]SFJ61290.1 sporulation integral membrane protein YlbJ [Thermoflavimicrobium dichotomicum]
MVPRLLHRRIHSIVMASMALCLGASLIMYPEQAFLSSLRGLKIWWEVVFPALLPFFIVAEVMMSFGVVHFIGILLEPLMRPIFRVPGVGAFVMAVGFISGNPMGAKLTSRLREQRLISREEGERLVSFTSTTSPLFIFGAVGVGFFKSTSVGVILALAHYLSSLLVGLVMRFHQAHATPTPLEKEKSEFLLIRALKEMHRARVKDGRPLGQLLGEAVTSAVNTLLLIGGFIMMFSVLVHLINHIGLTTFLSDAVEHTFTWLQFPHQLSVPFLAGLFEITLGSQMVSESSHYIPLVYQLVVVSMFFGWNGLSIQAQIASILSQTDIRYSPYFFARILHGFLAGAITLLIWKPLKPFLSRLPADLPTLAPSINTHFFHLWEVLQWFAVMVIISWLIFLFLHSDKRLIR